METASALAPLPKISISIRIDPSTHSFANPHPPTLHLTTTSHHPSPITIYADDLSPKLMLNCGDFIITDLTTGGTHIRQSIRTNCRIPPPTKVSVPLNESLFHTLLPNVPLTLSAPFARTGDNPKPLSKIDSVSAEAETDGRNSNESSAARHGACGVDGLEPGHRYVLSLAIKPRVSWNVVRWWEYGTKEQVLRGDGDGAHLDGRRVKWGPGPHPAIVVDMASVTDVEFECVE